MKRDYLGVILAGSLALTLLGLVYLQNTQEEEPLTTEQLCTEAMHKAMSVDMCRSDAACVLTRTEYEQYITLTKFGREHCANERQTSKEPKESLRTEEAYRGGSVRVGDSGTEWEGTPDVQASE